MLYYDNSVSIIWLKRMTGRRQDCRFTLFYLNWFKKFVHSFRKFHFISPVYKFLCDCFLYQQKYLQAELGTLLHWIADLQYSSMILQSPVPIQKLCKRAYYCPTRFHPNDVVHTTGHLKPIVLKVSRKKKGSSMMACIYQTFWPVLTLMMGSCE